MYTNKLIDAYKDQMNYVQYKQIAPDLGISPQMLTDVRKGRTYLKENQVLMMAEAVGEDKEKAMIGLAMDKAKSYEARQAWANIAKKFNGLGLTTITMAYVGFAVTFLDVNECVLSALMFNIAYQRLRNETFIFESFINEILRNDKKLCFS